MEIRIFHESCAGRNTYRNLDIGQLKEREGQLCSGYHPINFKSLSLNCT